MNPQTAQTPPSPRLRYLHIDLLEAIAITFVLIYHLPDYTDFLNPQNGRLHYVLYYLTTILSTCVPLFFFANGFLLLNQEFTLKKHIFRGLRIVALTLVWAYLTLWILCTVQNTPLTLKEMRRAVLIWKHGYIHHLWYMGALVCIYVFFPLIKTAYDRSRTVFYYFVIITAVLTFGNTFINIIYTILHHHWTGSTQIVCDNWFNSFNPYRGLQGYSFVYFCIGGCAKEMLPILAKHRKKCNCCACIALIVSMGLLWGTGIVLSRISGSVWDVVWDGYDTIFTLINVLSLFCLATNYQGKHFGKTIVAISVNTLGIYFLHWIIIRLLPSHIQGFLATYLLQVPAALSILAASLAIVCILKKIPLLKHIVS